MPASLPNKDRKRPRWIWWRRLDVRQALCAWCERHRSGWNGWLVCTYCDINPVAPPILPSGLPRRP